MPKKKFKLKLIAAVIIVIVVVGVTALTISSRIKAARNETFLNTVVLNIEPKGQPATKITLDLRKSDEMLIEELTEAVEPLFPINPIDEDAGRISYSFKATQVDHPTLREYVNSFPRRPPTLGMEISRDIRFDIRYVKDSTDPYRLSSMGRFTWSTNLPESWLHSFKDEIANYRTWIDHCTTAEYSLFKEMVVKEIVTDSKTNFINFIKKLTPNNTYVNRTLEPIKE